MKTQRRMVCLGVLVVAACSPEPIGGPPADETLRPSFEITGTCGTGATISGFNRNWQCGDKIRLNPSGATSSELAELSAATGTWNGAVLGAYNLPMFVSTGNNKTIQVTFSGSGDYYCGQASTTGLTLSIARFGTSSGCTHPGRLSTGTLQDLFVHELAHSIGFQSNPWHKPSSTNVTGHCAVALYDAGRPLNPAPCQHEIEVIHAVYGLRAAPNMSKHVTTGLSGLANVTIETNSSTVLTVSSLRFARANGSMCGQPNTTSCTGSATPANATLTWSSNSSVITLSGSGASRTATSGSTTGQATVTVGATTSLYEKAASFGNAGTGTKPVVTVYVEPPAGRPTLLSASNITSTSATVSWTNGDTSAGTTTIVQYRITGQSPWITAHSGLAAGVSSYNLTGLRCATSYDVNVYHQKNGINSAWMTLTLFTTSACQPSPTLNPPTNVRVSGCTPSTSGGKPYATYTLSWTAAANPSSTIWQIGSKGTNSPSTADIIRTGPITTTSGTAGPYLTTNGTARYFWVRYVNGSQARAWMAALGRPVGTGDGCAL